MVTKIISKQHVQPPISKQVGCHGSKELVSRQQSHPDSSCTYKEKAKQLIHVVNKNKTLAKMTSESFNFSDGTINQLLFSYYKPSQLSR